MKKRTAADQKQTRQPRPKPSPPETGLGTTRSVSIKEIARLAGVSIGTVDRVVHNRGRVSLPTLAKVQRIIEDRGYRPNIFASRLSRAKVFRFGVLMPHPTQDSSFWQLPQRGIAKAASELKPLNIQVAFYFFDKFTAAKKDFDHLYRQILDEPPDGLLVAPVVPNRMSDFLARLPESCPYVFFDSTLPNSRPVSSIIQDSFQSGVLAARLAELLTAGCGKIAIIQMVPTDFHLQERARGFRSRFARHSGMSCLDLKIEGARIDESYREALSGLMKTHPDLNGVFVTNATTFKAAEFLKQSHPNKRVHVIGYDLIPENIKLIKEGWIDFLINQRPEMQGYAGIYTLYRKLVLREPVQTHIMMPIDVIVKENLAYYENREQDQKGYR